MTGKESQDTISHWAEETFPGPADDPARGQRAQALKLIGEAVELAYALGCTRREIEDDGMHAARSRFNWTERRPEPDNVGKEIGDCAIVLAVLAGRTGHSIGAEVDAAMATNRKRTWKVDASGSAQHKEVKP